MLHFKQLGETIAKLFCLQAELKGYSKDNFSRLDDMKERATSLRSAREETRKNVSVWLQ